MIIFFFPSCLCFVLYVYTYKDVDDVRLLKESGINGKDAAFYTWLCLVALCVYIYIYMEVAIIHQKMFGVLLYIYINKN